MSIPLLQRMNRFPPFQCRLVARIGKGRTVRPLTNQDIAERSGLSVATVSNLSRLKLWDTVPVATAMAFAEACGVDFLRLAAQRNYLRRRKLSHLDRYPAFFRRLLEAINSGEP
jgi:transcriptional regulator with XRE-family HTH domain